MANIGETVTIMGWVQKNRNKGGLVFVDVRDRSGIIQVVCEEEKTDAALIEKAAKLRSEYVIAVVGKVEMRLSLIHILDALLRGEGKGMKLSLTYYPDINEYRGKKSPQIVITHCQ